ncbi:MAG: endonuclease III [bacterium]
MAAPILSLSKTARTRRVNAVLDKLAAEYRTHELAEVTGRDPYRVLIGGILSARTKDTQTAPVCRKLFKIAPDPLKLAAVPERKLKELIRPVGFYNQKSKAVRETARILLDAHGGTVPSTRDELMALPGVGRKVANLVLSVAFGQAEICVDTHVHRISNRLGWVESDDVLDTEMQLRELLPASRHRTVNFTLVRHGQECCLPVAPYCSACPVAEFCARVGIGRSR